MAVDMSALSRMQIETFFAKNSPITQKQCDDNSKEKIGKSVRPTVSQGGTSYTVEAGKDVVQSRVPGSFLDMTFMNAIEQAYAGFTPKHKDYGPFHTLRVYTMNNIGGDSVYLARDYLQKSNYKLLQNTINSYARFVNISALTFLSETLAFRGRQLYLRLTRFG
jgi:hypothetical protein